MIHYSQHIYLQSLLAILALNELGPFLILEPILAQFDLVLK